MRELTVRVLREFRLFSLSYVPYVSFEIFQRKIAGLLLRDTDRQCLERKRYERRGRNES